MSSLFQLQDTRVLCFSPNVKLPPDVSANIFLTLLFLSTPNQTGYAPSAPFETEMELNFFEFIFFISLKIFSVSVSILFERLSQRSVTTTVAPSTNVSVA